MNKLLIEHGILSNGAIPNFVSFKPKIYIQDLEPFDKVEGDIWIKDKSLPDSKLHLSKDIKSDIIEGDYLLILSNLIGEINLTKINEKISTDKNYIYLDVINNSFTNKSGDLFFKGSMNYFAVFDSIFKKVNNKLEKVEMYMYTNSVWIKKLDTYTEYIYSLSSTCDGTNWGYDIEMYDIKQNLVWKKNFIRISCTNVESDIKNNLVVYYLGKKTASYNQKGESTNDYSLGNGRTFGCDKYGNKYVLDQHDSSNNSQMVYVTKYDKSNSRVWSVPTLSVNYSAELFEVTQEGYCIGIWGTQGSFIVSPKGEKKTHQINGYQSLYFISENEAYAVRYNSNMVEKLQFDFTNLIANVISSFSLKNKTLYDLQYSRDLKHKLYRCPKNPGNNPEYRVFLDHSIINEQITTATFNLAPYNRRL